MKQTKRLFSLLLAFALLITCTPYVPLKAEAAKSGHYTYNVSNGKAVITKVSTAISGDVTVPTTLGGYSVAEIANSAFSLCSEITSVEIPDSVTTIGRDAFYSCTSLISVDIGASVETIGEQAFIGCQRLTVMVVDPNNPNLCSENGVLFNKNVTKLFYYPTGKTGTYSIPDTVTTIGAYAFGGCTGLTGVEIPNSVTTIEKSAFAGCTSLTSVEIPDSVITINDGGFSGCTGLVSVDIGDAVTVVERNAFSYCSKMTSVKIGTSVAAVGYNAFYNCASLTHVDISDIKTWCEIAFEDAYANPLYYAKQLRLNGSTVKELKIPVGVTSIGNYAFQNLASMISVEIPDSVTTIGSSAFAGCDSLTGVEIPDSVETIGSYAFYNCTKLTTVKLPGAVTTIKTCTFYYCTGLTSVEIPDSVTNIEDSAFSYCTNLASVKIPNSVTNIGKYAFYRCTSLTSVDIPDSVTAIEGWAFATCTGLTSLNIGNSVATIGSGAFMTCTSLTEIRFEGEAPDIGQDAFKGVTSTAYYYADETWTEEAVQGYGGTITWVALEKEPENGLSGECGAEGDNLAWVLDEDGTLTISGTGEMKEGGSVLWQDIKDSIKRVVVESGVTTIGAYAFSDFTSLASVELSDSVTAIGSDAFGGCTSLADIWFSGSAPSFAPDVFRKVTSSAHCWSDETWTKEVMQDYGGDITWIETEKGQEIVASGACGAEGDNLSWNLDKEGTLTISGTGAMADFSSSGSNKKPWDDYRNSVKKVVIEKGVTTIGSNAFDYCWYIESVEIPDSVTSIGVTAFFSCSDLKDVYIPCSVTTIGNSAFGSCTQLTTVVISDSVTAIGSSAFSSCTSLKSVYISNSITSIEYGTFARCNRLTSVRIPSSVTFIGSNAFDECYDMEEVWFEGSAPDIADTAFKNSGVTAYYYPDATWTEEVMQDYGGNVTWVAIQTVASGACGAGGDNITWALDNRGMLSLSGTGEMQAFDDLKSAPWYDTRESVKEVVIENGITTIGDGLFEGCSNLAEVRFEGIAPIMGSAVFDGVTATAYYYPDKTWTEEVMQSYGGNITWVALEPKVQPGEFTGDGVVTDEDVIYLLWYTVFPEDYPLNGADADFTGDGTVTDADVIYLLWHTVFPEDYPLEK